MCNCNEETRVETVEIPVWRYESLLHKEAIYEAERRALMMDKYRGKEKCAMYDIPTREEEEKFNSRLEEFREKADRVFSKCADEKGEQI